MRYCDGRLQAMLSLLPHQQVIDDNHYFRLHSTFPSVELFRASMVNDINRLADSDFKSRSMDFLYCHSDLNVLLDEFVKLLPKKANRKRGKKKKSTRSAVLQPDQNKARASEFARNQDLWNKNKRRLWDLIKLGDIRSKTKGNESKFFEILFKFL